MTSVSMASPTGHFSQRRRALWNVGKILNPLMSRC
jgi:hypothetical protein